MKKQYIAPSLFFVKLEMHSYLMQGSVIVNKEKEIELDGENNGDFGLAREENNGGNIWDNAW
jgi:hypothetical protein